MNNNPFLSFVDGIRQGVQAARGISIPQKSTRPATGPVVLLFSPHPDDECITGLLPLRLMRECGYRIVNVPVTHGSAPDRRATRHAEMRAACDWLGWEVWSDNESLEALTSAACARALGHFQPAAVFFPHAADWNSTHLLVHQRVMEALSSMPADFSCAVIETEFWGAMDDPNLMVEGDSATVADLVAATSLHTGEVARNPYHLLLPAWMQDNVRRGAERVGGQGGSAPAFDFATLYRIGTWKNSALVPHPAAGSRLAAGDHLAGFI